MPHTGAAPGGEVARSDLRAGGHVLSLIGIATNCTAEDVDDRWIFAEPGAAVTKVVFRVVCRR